MKPPPIIRVKPASWAPLLVAVVAAVLALGVLFVFDPARHAFYPQCLFHATTGLHCPGCGGLRGLHELLHGHWQSALRMNLLAFGLAPVLVVLSLVPRVPGGGQAHGRGTLWGRRWFLWLVGGAVVAFGVLRNLPVQPFIFLAP